MNFKTVKKIKKNLNRGFNLMEIIIWVGIVSVLGGIISFSSVSLIQSSKVNSANQELSIYSAALLEYYNAKSIFPSQDEGLMALAKERIIDIPNKKKEFTDPNQIFTDPWNTPYIYSVNNDGQGYSIKSLGSDKKEGGGGNAKDLTVNAGDTGDIKDFRADKVND